MAFPKSIVVALALAVSLLVTVTFGLFHVPHNVINNAIRLPPTNESSTSIPHSAVPLSLPAPTSASSTSGPINPHRFRYELVGPDQVPIDYAFHISSISPSFGPPGTRVTLTGSGLADPYINVDFSCAVYETNSNSPACLASTPLSNSPASVLSNSSSTLIFKIDDLTRPGQYLVSLYDIVTTPPDGGELTSDNMAQFTVTSSTPPVPAE